MIFRILMIISVCLVLFLGSLSSSRGQESARQGSGSEKLSDQMFAKMANQINLLEITLGQHAALKAKQPEVRKFGKEMVADHSEAQKQLDRIAAKHNQPTTTKLDAKHQAMADKLVSFTGEDFDLAYIQEMVKGHKKAAELMEQQRNYGKDTELKSYAGETLPVVQMHLKMAESILKKIQQSATR